MLRAPRVGDILSGGWQFKSRHFLVLRVFVIRGFPGNQPHEWHCTCFDILRGKEQIAFITKRDVDDLFLVAEAE